MIFGITGCETSRVHPNIVHIWSKPFESLFNFKMHKCFLREFARPVIVRENHFPDEYNGGVFYITGGMPRRTALAAKRWNGAGHEETNCSHYVAAHDLRV